MAMLRKEKLVSSGKLVLNQVLKQTHMHRCMPTVKYTKVQT